jgi:hypothetical protein
LFSTVKRGTRLNIGVLYATSERFLRRWAYSHEGLKIFAALAFNIAEAITRDYRWL